MIYKVTDERFKKYGKIIKNIDFSSLMCGMKDTPLPDDVLYEASSDKLERTEIAEEIKNTFYGELPIQIGYCNGHNVMLNALEYHRSSEINVAVTDVILMVGLVTDITDDLTYDTSNVEAFFLPAGTAVEIYSTTLHYAPCQVSENGFKVAVILPRGTNAELETKHFSNDESGNTINEDRLITAKNKWLIGHLQAGLPEGTHIGLTGNNLSVSDFM